MTLRRLSPKRQSRLPDEREFRERLFERVNYACEWCNPDGKVRVWPALQQHEIARGPLRARARLEWFACLALCDACHTALHRMASDDAVILGLALIQLRRPDCYSLANYHELTGRNWPDQRDVDRWAKRLSLKGSV